MSLRGVLAGCLVAMLLGYVGVTLAAEMATEATVTGSVKAIGQPVEKGPVAVVEVQSKTAAGLPEVITYRVVNDDQGKKLAKDANGKQAEVKGTVTTKDGDRWLTVKEFKVIETAAAK
jgi:hypothetical protein